MAEKNRFSIGQLAGERYAGITANDQYEAALAELKSQLVENQIELKETNHALSRAEDHVRRLKQDVAWFRGQPQGTNQTSDSIAAQAAALLDECKGQVPESAVSLF